MKDELKSSSVLFVGMQILKILQSFKSPKQLFRKTSKFLQDIGR